MNIYAIYYISCLGITAEFHLISMEAFLFSSDGLAQRGRMRSRR